MTTTTVKQNAATAKIQVRADRDAWKRPPAAVAATPVHLNAFGHFLDVVRWNGVVNAETARERSQRNRVGVSPRYSTPRSPVPVSAHSSGCYAQPYIPAWIVTRESRGDPTVINGGGHAASPYLSGGRSWGCFQFMPGTWNSSCAGLGYDVASQIECARRVSNGGTNLRPWAL